MEGDPVEQTRLGSTKVDIKYDLGKSASDHCIDVYAKEPTITSSSTEKNQRMIEENKGKQTPVSHI